MTKTLEGRLRQAKIDFATIDTELGLHVGKLPPDVDAQFRLVTAFATNIEHWIEMIAARTAARLLLTDLESQADGNDTVLLGTARVKYQHVRLIGVQAYLATTWALADRIVGLVGHVFCIRSSLNDPKSAPQLVSHFIGDDTKKKTAALAFYSLRQTFGWPIAVSYALRNHFVHDGGQSAGVDFFDGPAAASGFKISLEGWTRIEVRAKEHGVDPNHQRPGTNWPLAPRDDVRGVLDACERGTDDALGILVGSACRSLVAHVGCMLGQD